MSAHLVVVEATENVRVLRAARVLMKERFGIEHVTLQIEDPQLAAEAPDLRV
jgi:cobalt-zinc-cadmium efflux system protein